jgi:hypothetical protein
MKTSEIKKKAGDNENFVALIQAAVEDKAMRRQILAIVELDSFSRQSLLGTYISSLQIQGAPTELVEALNCLKDDMVAEKTRELMLNC